MKKSFFVNIIFALSITITLFAIVAGIIEGTEKVADDQCSDIGKVLSLETQRVKFLGCYAKLDGEQIKVILKTNEIILRKVD